MRARQNLIELFSTFLEFDFDRFKNWATDPKLQRSMKQSLQQSSQLETSENFWAIYWHKLWQQPDGLARGHLMAYLQESCYWAAHKTLANFSLTQYTLADCFQAAIANIDRVFKGFNASVGFHLKSYASITFSNLIREFLRQRQEVDITTDWALLRKISQKRLIEALENAGSNEETIARYVLAWTCLNRIHVPNQNNSVRKINQPDAETWREIALLYNQEAHKQLLVGSSDTSAQSLENWLLFCVKAVRNYLYPKVASLNMPRTGEDSGEMMDNLIDVDEDSLLEDLIVEEEEEQISKQQQEIKQVLTAAINELDVEVQAIVNLYYGQGLTQQEMAQHFNTKQYTISRRLSKGREKLLTALIQWSEKKLHVSLTPDVLKNISSTLEEWLGNHYRRAI